MYRLLARTLVSLSVLIALAVGLSRGDSFQGRVIGIKDGDTLKVLGASDQQHVIRLAGIDAPESSQAWGQRSKQSLSQLTFGKQVNLDCTSKESYGRPICKILLPGGEDVCLDQVGAGMAWHYKRYQREQSPADRKAYAAAEDTARHGHLGLWSDPHPIQPEDYRHGTATGTCFDKSDHRIDCSQAGVAVQIPAPANEAKPADEAKAAPPTANEAKTEPYTGGVRGNRNSLIYHWPGCPNYNLIAPGNEVEFRNSAAAEAAGYRAALNCP